LVLGRRVGFYKFKSELGAGNFSKVKLATHQLTKERVAVKVIDKTKLDSKTQRMVTREIQIMDSLCHPHLIRLYEVVETINCLHLVMEYAHGGELFARLTGEKGAYRENPDAKVIFTQISSALDYMHTRFFIHRDLKAENVFFASTASDLNVKVGDFGFATQVNQIDQHLNTFCGSPPYAAPELFQDDHYFGPSVDIWALGVLLYFMVTGHMPFKGSTVAALKKSILDGQFEVPSYVSNDCTDLIKSVLRRKPGWRLSMEQIKSCDWLRGTAWPGPDQHYRPSPLILAENDKKEANTTENGTENKAEETINSSSDCVSNSKPPHSPASVGEPEEDAKHDLIVRKDLEVLGISRDHLESHAERGARSPLIGTYRILMHRLILTGDVNGMLGVPPSKAKLGDTLGHSQDCRRSSGAANSGLTSPASSPLLSQNSYNSRNVSKQELTTKDQLDPNKPRGHKSKACNIL